MLNAVTPSNLRCEWLTTPLGIDTPAPRLSWELNTLTDLPGCMQLAYRVTVGTMRESLQTSNSWDSGWIASGAQTCTYSGPELTSGTRYFWQVETRVRDAFGRLYSGQSTSWWEMGLLSSHDWEASWIFLPLPPAPHQTFEPVRYLRRTFTLSKVVQRARLYITARGLYEAAINGQRIGDAWLTPGWTNYDIRLQYQTYDVTPLLSASSSYVLSIQLASGWYCGHVSNTGPYFYGSTPQLLAQLHIEYDDGTSQQIVSDSQWCGSTGPLLQADLQMGETYDACREEPGWDTPFFDDRAWQPVCTLPRTALPRLVADCAQPVRITEQLPPRQITRKDDGTYLIDFGQNLVGWIRLEIPARARETITLRHAEMLDSDGCLYVANLRSAQQTDRYIPTGADHPVTYMPRFTFHGFRYVELTGYPGLLTSDAISACVIGSDTPRIGLFSCGHPLVNQLYQNIVWGQRGNFISVPTDCPQRDERLGWMGDAQVFACTAAYNMDVSAFFTKWMRDVLDEQSPNGAFADGAPTVMLSRNGAPAWGDAGVIIPWTMYRMYGDIRLVEQCWEGMTHWMEYLTSANPTGLRLARNGANFGDWLALDIEAEDHMEAMLTPKDLLATAYYAYIAHLMAEMAQALTRPIEALYYERLYQQIRQMFIKTYVQDDGRITSETQTSYVLALAFDLVPHAARAHAARHLVADIERRGWHLSTGFLGVGYLLPVLTELGYTDVAYRLLLQESYPSWGYSIRQGATTIWERWDGWTEQGGFRDPRMNSFNHYSLGSVGEWLYRSVAGIEPFPSQDEQGYFRFAPHPFSELGWARAAWRSVYGVVAISWQLTGKTLSLDITLPPNTHGMLILPASSPQAILQKLAETQDEPCIQHARATERTVEIQLQAGHFMLEVPFLLVQDVSEVVGPSHEIPNKRQIYLN